MVDLTKEQQEQIRLGEQVQAKRQKAAVRNKAVRNANARLRAAHVEEYRKYLSEEMVSLGIGR